MNVFKPQEKATGTLQIKHDSEILCVQVKFQFIAGVAVWSPEAHAKATVVTKVDMDTGCVRTFVD